MINDLPEPIFTKKYKETMISFKKNLKKNIIETEVDLKRNSDYSISKVIS